MMRHRYRNQSTHFRPETLRGNLSVYKDANVQLLSFGSQPQAIVVINSTHENFCSRNIPENSSM